MHALATRPKYFSRAEGNVTSDIRGRLEKEPGGAAPQHEAVTFWLWLWLCRASCSSAVDRAGPVSSGMAGGAPRRPEIKHGCSVITHPQAQLQVLNMLDGPEGSRQGRVRLACWKPCSLLGPPSSCHSHQHGRSGLCVIPLPPYMACLTLLATGASLQQGIEEQLEGGRWAQVVQQLQDIWLRQESLASIESLRKRPEGGSEQRPQSEDIGV